MENKVKKLNYDELLEILRQYDTESIFDKVNVIPDSEDLHEAISEYINLRSFVKRSVLGIDIYRYRLTIPTISSRNSGTSSAASAFAMP